MIGGLDRGTAQPGERAGAPEARARPRRGFFPNEHHGAIEQARRPAGVVGTRGYGSDAPNSTDSTPTAS
jgi:hypothetical protein